MTDLSDRRDREVARTAGRRMVSPFMCRVVGVSFTENYPDNLHSLAAAADEATALGERLTVLLKRNPDNEYDSNAIEVHVPALGSMIGHLERPIAARLAQELDDQQSIWVAEVVEVLIDPKHPDRPGITIRAMRKG